MIDSADPRPFTPLLIGARWPAPPLQPTGAIAHWDAQSRVKDHVRVEIRNHRTQLNSSNQGHTAEDLMVRMAYDEQRLLDVAERCQHKSEANREVVNAATTLPTNLSGIANSGNDEIEKILSENTPFEHTVSVGR